ncbi:class I SAM-dependent methyltransferase [Patescibacteria group bacterium]|nr:class I SAM-dependent methyltransferase [Patescibacteria group bacterium]MBU1123490.1 class I SAM-dependent methyltransferase [Patescibacteria group bacterium]MBU1911520.1 class I SAM-dependent methyltransferase [Patescibacteria group bacterium]
MASNIKGFSPEDLLKSVHEGYNSFAQEWSNTRGYAWYEFEFIKEKIEDGSNVLDLGCGNGRLFKYLKGVTDVQYKGVDNSEKLIEIAKQNIPEGDFEVGDVLKLPFEDNSFDTVISIAVAHHITPRTNRVKFFDEISRVLKPESAAFVTVWNIHQDKYKKYLKMNMWHKIIQTIKSPFNTSFGFGDCLIPFGEQKTLRYIHAFTPDEVAGLVKDKFEILETLFTDKDEVIKDWKEARNLCFYLRKT